MSAISQIQFRSELSGYLGVEQEFFLCSSRSASSMIQLWGATTGDEITVPTPRSPEFLKRIADNRWTYELSACQVEFRTRPHPTVAAVCEEIAAALHQGSDIAAAMGCRLDAVGYQPDNMPLDVYPSERNGQIAAQLPREVLRAACQVAGIHVHYGCRDIDHALAVYHALRECTHVFEHMGDFSGGKRLATYRLVKPDPAPPPYASVAAFDAAHTGSLRDCYHMVRITPYGTVEVRAFGSTSDMGFISSFVHLVQSIGNSVD